MLNTKEDFKQLDATLTVMELDDEVAATCSGGADISFGGSNPDVILYDEINLGVSYGTLRINAKLNGGDANLDNDRSLKTSGWNNRTSSILVIRGTWKIYQNNGYKGKTVTLKPGFYRTPAAFGLPNDSLTGIKRVG